MAAPSLITENPPPPLELTRKTRRQPELDALRGVFLFWMALTHLPTPVSDWANQPIGFVSAAEGFVFLSAMLTGKLHARMAREDSAGKLRSTLWSRARRVYGYHLLLLAFAFSIALWLGFRLHRPDLWDLLDVYTLHPWISLPALLTLFYCPALLDILPMYVLFLLGTPWVLRAALRAGWGWVLAASGIVWLAAQFGFRAWLYRSLSHAIGHAIPMPAIGAFDLWAWQFLWIAGLWLGDRAAMEPYFHRRFPRWTIGAALAVAIAGACLRRGWPTEILWSGKLAFLEDKWKLAPVRILDFAALTLLVSRGMEWIKRVLAWRPLAAVGSSSIQVFTAHVLCVLLALALVGRDGEMLHGARAAFVIAATYAVMMLTGLIATSHKLRAKREQRAEARGHPLPEAEGSRL